MSHVTQRNLYCWQKKSQAAQGCGFFATLHTESCRWPPPLQPQCMFTIFPGLSQPMDLQVHSHGPTSASIATNRLGVSHDLTPGVSNLTRPETPKIVKLESSRLTECSVMLESTWCPPPWPHKILLAPLSLAPQPLSPCPKVVIEAERPRMR